MPRPRTRKPAHLEVAGLDPLGRPLEEWERALVEPVLTGFCECIDRYESEVNGLRTAAAMREAGAQGFYPGGLTPYGYCKVPVEVHAGMKPRYRLAVEPILDAKTFALVQELCHRRRPSELPGRAAAKPRVLTGLVRCGLCGASYQLETSGKSLDGSTYSYCYYNCRRTLRAGKKACPGHRVRVEDLDGAVLAAIADAACTPERAALLAYRHGWPPMTEIVRAWRNLILSDHDIGRTYALHLIEHGEVHGERVVLVPKDAGGRKEFAVPAPPE